MNTSYSFLQYLFTAYTTNIKQKNILQIIFNVNFLLTIYIYIYIYIVITYSMTGLALQLCNSLNLFSCMSREKY